MVRGPARGQFNNLNQFGLSQSVSLENEAFSASLSIKNVLDQWSLDGVTAEIVVSTKPLDPETGGAAGRRRVCHRAVPNRQRGRDSLSGHDSAGRDWTPEWNLVPGSGLGGNVAGGVTYYVQAIVRFQVQGKAGQFITSAQAITVQPAPTWCSATSCPTKANRFKRATLST